MTRDLWTVRNRCPCSWRQAAGQVIARKVDACPSQYCSDRKEAFPRRHQNRPAMTSRAGLMERVLRYCTLTCVQPPKEGE